MRFPVQIELGPPPQKGTWAANIELFFFITDPMALIQSQSVSESTMKMDQDR